MELSGDLRKLTKRCILLVLLLATIVNASANEEGTKYFENEVKLLTIKNRTLNIIQNFMELKHNEIKDTFKNSAARKFLINFINDIEIWWKKDVSQRSELVLNKYAGNILHTSDPNISIEDLELELENGLTIANEYWMDKIDKKITDLKEIPFKKSLQNKYYGINKAIQQKNNYEELRLPTAELQLKFNSQLMFILNITNTTKVIAETQLAKIKADELFDNSSTTFISELLNVDRYKSRVRDGMFNFMYFKERDAIDRLKKLWIVNQFIPENINFCSVALIQLKNNLQLINQTMLNLGREPHDFVGLN